MMTMMMAVVIRKGNFLQIRVKLTKDTESETILWTITTKQLMRWVIKCLSELKQMREHYVHRHHLPLWCELMGQFHMTMLDHQGDSYQKVERRIQETSYVVSKMENWFPMTLSIGALEPKAMGRSTSTMMAKPAKSTSVAYSVQDWQRRQANRSYPTAKASVYARRMGQDGC